jgi:AcrR family transcriptional regulator
MARPTLHATDDLLDAARDLVVAAGPRAVGIRDIAKRSGAPSGTLYHRFGSRDALVARTWLRAVQRFQAGFVDALATEDPVEAAARAVRWGVAFALAEPGDAQLLLGYSRSDLLDAEPEGGVIEELAAVNAPIERAVVALAARRYGAATADALERVTYAVIDLPLAVVRRHLRAGTLTAGTAARLESAVRTLLTNDDDEESH